MTVTIGKSGILNDGLNEDQLKKRDVDLECSDANSSVKRQRVRNQTLFDRMFVEGFIGIHHHEASHKFIDDIARSGSSIPSINLSKINTGSRQKNSSSSERRMIFSEAFRSIIKNSDEDSVKMFMRISNRPYDDEYKDINESDLLKLSKYFTFILDSLADHYNIRRRKDPRKIIFNQMYKTVPKKHI